VTGKTTPLVDHRQLRVTTRFELRQRQMAARQLVMAAAAKIRYVANRTARSIERRVFSVNVVLPPRRV
jgi:hypothetical protein